jgi:transposase-like protein
MGRGIDAALHSVWRKRMVRFEASMATVAEFCRREEVSSAAFYQWRRRLAQDAKSAARECGEVASRLATPGRAARVYGRPAGFVELTLPAAAVVELDLPNGVRIRVPTDQEAALDAVIRAAGEVAGHVDTTGKEVGRC